MPFIPLSPGPEGSPLILIFAEGTVLAPRSFWQLYRLRGYVPADGCADKLRIWMAQGAQIVYCTSRRGKQAFLIAGLLIGYGFPGSRLYYRERGEEYGELIGSVRPAVLIEDDCRSIGGYRQTCASRLSPAVREKIRSIIVPEFRGLGHLPDSLQELLTYSPKDI